VGFYGLTGDEQGGCGFGIIEPPPDGPGDLELLRAEGLQGGLAGVVPGTDLGTGGG
jgi:hypothetical protein